MSSLCDVFYKMCRACLAVGENVKFTEIGDKMRYFQEYLKINVNLGLNPKPLLCHECSYRIGRILSYGDKVAAADAILDKLCRTTSQSAKLVNRNNFMNARYDLKFPILTIHANDTILKVEAEESALIFVSLKDEMIEKDESNGENACQTAEQLMPPIDANVIKHEEVDFDNDNDELFNNNSDEDVLKEIQEKLRAGSIKAQNARKKSHLRGKLVKRKRLNKADIGVRVRSIFLSRDEALDEMQVQSSQPKYVRAEFKCELCCKGFYVQDIYKRHLKKHDQASGDYFCDICQQYFVSEHELSKHETVHRKRFQCTKCAFTRTCYGVVADHYSDEHERKNMRDIQCNICGKTFSKQNTYRKHACHQEKVECKFCNKIMLKSSINKHVMDLHTEDKPFACTVCKQCFSSSQSLRMHTTMRHPDGMEYCTECDLFFKNKAGLRNHLKMTLKHIKEEYLKQCPHCPARLPYWKRLSHIDREHRVGGFVCAECGVAYASRTSLSRHGRVVHRKIEKERRYVCETCGKGFTVRKTLESHMNIHSGARPYKCESCDSTFAHPAALYTHNRLVHLKLKRGCNASRRAERKADNDPS